MEKLDRSGWAAGFAFLSHGVRVGIRANAPEVLEEVVDRLPVGWRPCTDPRVDRLYSIRLGAPSRPDVRYFHLLYADATQVVRSLNVQDLFLPLEYDIEAFVAEHAPRRVFLHAGAVGWKGEAILVPGGTRSGKTTLVAALVKAGATYYSDEFAVLDQQGRVHPYPRPLSIRQENGAPHATPVEAIGGRVGRRPLPVGIVLATRYEFGRVWRPREVSSGRMIMRLVSHSFSTRRAPRQVLSVLVKVVERARNLSGARGDASELVRVLLEKG
jgi:hypothetical protein